MSLLDGRECDELQLSLGEDVMLYCQRMSRHLHRISNVFSGKGLGLGGEGQGGEPGHAGFRSFFAFWLGGGA